MHRADLLETPVGRDRRQFKQIRENGAVVIIPRSLEHWGVPPTDRLPKSARSSFFGPRYLRTPISKRCVSTEPLHLPLVLQ